MSRGARARARRAARRAQNRAEQRIEASGILLVDGQGESMAPDVDQDALVAAASGSTDLPLSDRGMAWDAAAARKTLDPGDFAAAHFWRDASKPADQITSYKLPFAKKVDGKLVAVWRGVTAGAARLPGTTIPGGDKSGVQSKMGAYYSKAAKQYDDPSIEVPWKAGATTDADVFERTPGDQAVFEARQAMLEAFEENGDLMAVLEEYAPAASAKCADCGHMALAHGGDSNMGACSMKGCDCTGYAAKSTSSAEVNEEFYALLNGDGEGGYGVWTTSATTTNGSFFLLDETWEITETGFGRSKKVKSTGGPKITIKTPGKLPERRIKLAKGTDADADDTGDDTPTLPGNQPPKKKKVQAAVEELTKVGGSDAVTPTPKKLIQPIVPVGWGGPLPPVLVDDVELPDDHQPGQRLPRRNPGPRQPAATLPDPSMGLKWNATLAPEGKATDDGRVFAPGSIRWRELPLSLMAMTKTADGHDGAEVAGRIDRIWRDDKAGLIRAAGVFDNGEYGTEIARLVQDGTLRGISVDIAPQRVDQGYRSDFVDEDGQWREDAPGEGDSDGPSALDLLFGGDERGKDDPPIYVVRDAVLGMATVCPFQAFSDAKIEPAASLVAAASDLIWTISMDSGMSVTAFTLPMLASGTYGPEMSAKINEWAEQRDADALTAAAAGMTPEQPPLEWFDDPALHDLTALTIDEDGHVYGHAAAWGTCHIGFPDVCTTAPRSMTNYSYFHLKEVETDDGAAVNVGTITLDTGHADRSLGRQATLAHYDDTGTAIADVVCGEDEFGIWVSGAVRPDASAEKVRKLRGATLSGDWRNVNGNLELVALLAVNVPGFPIPRTRAALQASAAGMEVTALVAAGVHMGVEGLTAEQRAEWDELRVIANDEWEKLSALAAGE